MVLIEKVRNSTPQLPWNKNIAEWKLFAVVGCRRAV